MADTRTQIQARYDAKNRKTISLKLNLNYDMDIITALESAESVNGYIKQALRDYTARIGSAPKKYPPTRYSNELYGCPKCGKEIATDMDFCPYCGIPFDK